MVERLPSRPRTRSRPAKLARGGGAAVLIAVLAGCHGRAAFHRGEDSFRTGQYRHAYLHYWDAYRAGPSSGRYRALRLAGRRVAEEELRAGRAAEAKGELEAALERYSLALEYDPGWAEALGAHERVSESIDSLSSARARLEAARSGEGWEELDALQAVVLHPSYRGQPEGDLRAAARRAGESLIGGLREGSLPQDIPTSPRELAEREAAWGAALASLEDRMLLEEEGECAVEGALREVSTWRACREGLREATEEARAALSVTRRALGGWQEFERASALEEKGDLAGAIEAYRAAAAHHPGIEGAPAGEARCLRRLLEESQQAALVAYRNRDWKKTGELLEGLLRFHPRNGEAALLLVSSRRELAGERLREAKRFEESGLSGNALVAYHLAIEAEPDLRHAREAIRRLEDQLTGRLRPRWAVEIRAADGEERMSRRDLWGVSEEALSRLERDVLQGARSALRGGEPGSPDWGGGKPETVLVEDLDFSTSLGDRSVGLERARHVESFDLIDNPDLEGARAHLAALRDDLERAGARAEAAPPAKRRLAEELSILARRRAEQAAAKLASLPGRVPVMAWGSAAFPVARRAFRAEIACRYRLGGESRWVAAEIELEDRRVDGDPERNIPPDPDDLLSRAEALRVLGPRAGEALARDAEGVIRARQDAYYREALSRIASRSFDLAVENLVPFLYSRRGREDALFADAARRLAALTGCDLPALWKARH